VANKEFLPKNNKNNDTATLYYFYTTWCPHCKTTTPHWESLKSETNGIVNNVNIIFREVDCDSDSTTADKFKIKEYPTFKLIHNNTIYNYDAKPEKDTLVKFLNSVIKPS